MVSVDKSLDKKQNDKNQTGYISDAQKNSVDLPASSWSTEQKLEFLNFYNVKDLLEISYGGKKVYEILLTTVSEEVQSKLLDVITSKAPDLLKATAPMFIKINNKAMIKKLWECIKKVDNPADSKILNSGEEEKLAYSLFTSKTGFSLVSDFLDWLQDASVLKADEKHQVEVAVYGGGSWSREGHPIPLRYETAIEHTYLINYIAKYGSNEQRLKLLNTMDRLKAYELLWLRDQPGHDIHLNDSSGSKCDRGCDRNELFYSILFYYPLERYPKTDKQILLKALDLAYKFGDNGTASIKSESYPYNLSDYNYAYGLASITAEIAHRIESDPLFDGPWHPNQIAASEHVSFFKRRTKSKANEEVITNSVIYNLSYVASNKMLALAEKLPSILGSRFYDNSDTVADFIAKFARNNAQEKLLKFVKIPSLEKAITEAINKYGTEESKKELQNLLMGPFKLRGK